MLFRHRALAHALTHVGTKEHPPNSNRGPKIDDWNERAGVPRGTPWCSSFCNAMFEDSGLYLRIPHVASVGFVEHFGEQTGMIVARPFKGDLVCYDWDSSGWPDHIGIVKKVLALRWRGKAFAGLIETVEGNTSYGDDSNGGRVMIRYRWVGSCKFVRIPGAPDPNLPPEQKYELVNVGGKPVVRPTKRS